MIIRFGFVLILAVASIAIPDHGKAETTKSNTNSATPTMSRNSASMSVGPINGVPKSNTSLSSKSSTPKHAVVLKDAKPIGGLIHTYLSKTRLFAEFSNSDYANEFIVLISISKGIGQMPILGGMSWGSGDDWVWSFRKIGDRVHIIRRNVRFKAKKNSPESKALHNAYTDSVLFSLPILTKGPKGGDLVDLTPVFMSDLPQISQDLPGFMFSSIKSTWEEVKGFERNLEVEVAATYSSGGHLEIDSVADSRGVSIHVHYSISRISPNGYQPRLADDRIGYFVTAHKDYSKNSDDDRFVRYINRWNLKKADPSAELSPPQEPIIFWLEKTIPFQYRKPIRDGIAEWNKAFEKAGFIDAIEIRQQPIDAPWDPEDVRFNTFRWITSSAGFAMGPSRVNPYTGQILDADIIFDADFIESWKSKFETMTPESIAAMTGGPLDLKGYQEQQKRQIGFGRLSCQMSQEMARQMAFGRAAVIANFKDKTTSVKLQQKMISQGLKEVAMHEVGHTLGLRHNFKASTFLTLQEANDVSRTSKVGMSASVMDYAPVHIAGKSEEQGDFYSTTIGPYDYWAIEYGYKPLSGGTLGEKSKLREIAARSGEPGHAYATDEDTRGIDPDPFANRFDFGKDPLEFARHQAKIISDILPNLVDQMTDDGDNYAKARRAFNVLLGKHGQAMFFVARFIGGLDVSRSHKGDKHGAPPFRVVETAKQREALKLLADQVFSDEPFTLKPEFYNLLAPSRWSHWGMQSPTRSDFPVHDYVEMWQDRILSQLLSSLTLTRIHDSEIKVPSDQEAFTTAELFASLTQTIFNELDHLNAGEFTNRKPAISSLRRNLQRGYMTYLSHIAMGNTAAPEDCQAIAYAELSKLAVKMDEIAKQDNLDGYSKAHLKASADRIRKVTNASLMLYGP